MGPVQIAAVREQVEGVTLPGSPWRAVSHQRLVEAGDEPSGWPADVVTIDDPARLPGIAVALAASTHFRAPFELLRSIDPAEVRVDLLDPDGRVLATGTAAGSERARARHAEAAARAEGRPPVGRPASAWGACRVGDA